jgi:hypothetical protein
VMDHHLGSVEHRALLDQGREQRFDLGAVLSHYAEAADTRNPPKVARLPGRKARATK